MAKKSKAYFPVQRRIRLRDQTAAVANGRFFQATKLLGQANRRLYRQSYVYNMKVDVDIDSALATQGVEVFVLRDTWDLHGAYKYAMKTYYNAMKEELEMGGARTRWHDFRVQPNFQSDELEAAVNNPNGALPTMDEQSLDPGQHVFSSVQDAAGVTRFFGLDQSTTGTVWSIIDEWQNKDRVDDDPSNDSNTMAYNSIVEDKDEANYDILRANGDSPPYAPDADTNLWTKVATIKQTSGGGGGTKLTTGFFEAPLGLVVLVSPGFTQSLTVHDLYVSFQSGDYKGVKAHRYATPMLTEAKEYEVV